VMESLPHDLVIVGRHEGMIGPDASVLERGRRSPDRVHFTGDVSDAELHDYVRGAAALVFPSRYEGFGLPPLEAMAAGCPCIVSSAASLPEVCGNAPLYFDPESAEQLAARLVELVSDESLRNALIVRGRAHAATYDWNRCAHSTIKSFDAALDGGSHPV
jgi:glycosyltransferase involved in cell wall biosynthesis